MGTNAGKDLARWVAVVGAVLSVAGGGAARAQEGVTEDEVLARWRARSGEVAALRARVRGARFDVVTAALWPNPQVSVGYAGNAVGEPTSGAHAVSVQWTQPLPIFGQVRARRDAAVAQLSRAEVEVAEALWCLASDLRGALVARAFADARVRQLEGNRTELERIDEIVRRRVEAGANSPYDALRSQAARATLDAAIDAAAVDRARADARVVALLADPAVTDVPITPAGLSGFRGPEDADALEALALRRRPDLELARRGVVASRAEAGRWRAENRWLPGVWLGLNGTDGPASFGVGVGLSFTVPTTDRNQGLIGRAEAEAEGLSSLEAAVAVRVGREVRGAWSARARARAALASFRSGGVAACEALIRRAEVTYQTGGQGGASFTVQDLFDAYRTLWDARSQELELRRAAAEAEADLERAAALVVP